MGVCGTQLVCMFPEAAVVASLGCLQFSVLGKAQLDSHIQVQALVPACSSVERQIETLREVFNPCRPSN